MLRWSLGVRSPANEGVTITTRSQPCPHAFKKQTPRRSSRLPSLGRDRSPMTANPRRLRRTITDHGNPCSLCDRIAGDRCCAGLPTHVSEQGLFPWDSIRAFSGPAVPLGLLHGGLAGLPPEDRLSVGLPADDPGSHHAGVVGVYACRKDQAALALGLFHRCWTHGRDGRLVLVDVVADAQPAVQLSLISPIRTLW